MNMLKISACIAALAIVSPVIAHSHPTSGHDPRKVMNCAKMHARMHSDKMPKRPMKCMHDQKHAKSAAPATPARPHDHDGAHPPK